MEPPVCQSAELVKRTGQQVFLWQLIIIVVIFKANAISFPLALPPL